VFARLPALSGTHTHTHTHTHLKQRTRACYVVSTEKNKARKSWEHGEDAVRRGETGEGRVWRSKGNGEGEAASNRRFESRRAKGGGRARLGKLAGWLSLSLYTDIHPLSLRLYLPYILPPKHSAKTSATGTNGKTQAKVSRHHHTTMTAAAAANNTNEAAAPAAAPAEAEETLQPAAAPAVILERAPPASAMTEESISSGGSSSSSSGLKPPHTLCIAPMVRLSTSPLLFSFHHSAFL